jgi:hypothetical protein
MATLLGTQTGPTIDSSGYLPGYSKWKPAEIRPEVEFFYRKLKETPRQGAYVQNELLEDFGAPGALPTPYLFGGGTTSRTTVPPIQTTPASTLTRTVGSSYIQAFEGVWSVSRILEAFVGEMGSVPGVNSELDNEIAKAKKVLAQQRERVFLSNQTAVLQSGTTPGRVGGAYTKVTTYANYAAAGGQPAAITDVTKEQLLTVLVAMAATGGSQEKYIYMPAAVIDKWARTKLEGMPDSMFTKEQSAKTLDLEILSMTSTVGIKTYWVVDVNGTKEGIIGIDHEQFSKRIIEPERVYRWMDGRRDHEGWIDQTLSLMAGQEAASFSFYTSNIINASGGA